MDPMSIVQAHANILAGACLALGLRFMGTGLQAAKEVLTTYLKHFAALRRADRDPRFADRATMETALSTAAIALSLVMAGTGHLETLRLLRSLRRVADRDSTYVEEEKQCYHGYTVSGEYIATHMYTDK